MWTNDHSTNIDRLSATARRLLGLSDAIFNEWETRLRSTVTQAAALPYPILINTFPGFLDNLAQAISPDYPRSTAVDTSTIATEHGGERARLTSYSPQSVIAEYQLLRWTILDVLRQNGVQLNDDELSTINMSIDHSVREAATAFALAQAAMRERFIATLAHDLRNPLQTAAVAAEVIMRIDDPAKMKEMAARIVDNARRADHMICSLLDSAVFQSGERLSLHISCFDMLDVMKEVCDQAQLVYRQPIGLMEKSVTGWWSREHIKRAIENLVGNAVKYGYPDAPIQLKIDCGHGRIMVTVHNEGDPIPPDQLESIFLVFRRASAAKEGDKQGWGIGLPYVRSVAESHGGSVGVDSGIERGTTFLIDVPVDARPYQGAPTLVEAKQ